ILDEEKWVLREVFEEYVMATGKKEIFDFSSFVEDHLQFLSKLDLFSTFKTKDLQLILSNLKSYNFQDQEYLTKEGEEGDQMFILLKGNVNVFKYNQEKNKDEKVAILGPGDVFGERTLLLGEPRSATIITEREGSILTMAQEDFKKLLKKSNTFKDKIQKMVDESFKFYGLLKSVPLFKEIPEEKLKMLAPKIKYKEFGEGDYIFRQGDKGDSFYILKEGKVEILTESDEGQTKSILATLGAGEFFGEIALFKDITRTASVKAIRKTIALSIEKMDFSHVFSEKRTLERVSSRRLKEMDFSVTKKEN
ncbi:cyclic nucleotide-binding domain-containing protein, partial [Bacteriovoracales bacterium]|nr:cyclic nucleotide-binding domain-containing protein [Bacteriovoracales bacterium]